MLRNVGPSDDLTVSVEMSSVGGKYPAKAHAARVAGALEDHNGLIYLEGAREVNYPDSDMPRRFRQNRYFYYLSGVDEPDCLVTYDIGRDRLILWISPPDLKRAFYNGLGLTQQIAMARYNIDDCMPSTELVKYIQDWTSTNIGVVYRLHARATHIRPQDLARSSYTSLQPAMDACRVIKDSHEIRLIREANDISSEAHRAVLRNLASYDNETQVEARFLDTCISVGAKHQSYDIIAGSGANAATLHYVKNEDFFGDSQLMVLDAGAEWHCYASDVTRTFPLSFTWPSPEARQIYYLVQDMQDAAMRGIGPGKSMVSAFIASHRVMVDGLLHLGIFHNGSADDIYKNGTSLAFYPHGLGHHVGLEVHDVSPPGTYPVRPTNIPVKAKHIHFEDSLERQMSYAVLSGFLPFGGKYHDTPLEEGMVITVEPGIYFNEWALKTQYLNDEKHSGYINRNVLERYMPVGGVRIEDDLLITATGFENLTTAPKGEEALRIIRGEQM